MTFNKVTTLFNAFFCNNTFIKLTSLSEIRTRHLSKLNAQPQRALTAFTIGVRCGMRTYKLVKTYIPDFPAHDYITFCSYEVFVGQESNKNFGTVRICKLIACVLIKLYFSVMLKNS